SVPPPPKAHPPHRKHGRASARASARRLACVAPSQAGAPVQPFSVAPRPPSERAPVSEARSAFGRFPKPHDAKPAGANVPRENAVALEIEIRPAPVQNLFHVGVGARAAEVAPAFHDVNLLFPFLGRSFDDAHRPAPGP